MKNIFNYSITDAVYNDIKEKFGNKLNELSKEKFIQIISEYKRDYERMHVWTDEDEQLICTLIENDFLKISELGVYMAEDSYGNTYYYYEEIGNTSIFFDSYLTYYTGKSELIMEAIDELYWHEEDNECYKEVQLFIEYHKDQKDGEDLIEFHGNEITDINREIAEFEGDNEDENYKIGTYLGRSIFEVNDKLYYLTDDSYSFNTEYNWYLQEVGEKCYEYFGY